MTVKTFKAGEDLTGKAGYAIKVDPTDGEVLLAGANEACLGILINDGAINRSVAVAMNGEGAFKCKLGGTVEFGDYLVSNADGELIKAATTAGNNNIIGQALRDGVDEQLIYVDIVKMVQTIVAT